MKNCVKTPQFDTNVNLISVVENGPNFDLLYISTISKLQISFLSDDPLTGIYYSYGHHWQEKMHHACINACIIIIAWCMREQCKDTTWQMNTSVVLPPVRIGPTTLYILTFFFMYEKKVRFNFKHQSTLRLFKLWTKLPDLIGSCANVFLKSPDVLFFLLGKWPTPRIHTSI